MKSAKLTLQISLIAKKGPTSVNSGKYSNTRIGRNLGCLVQFCVAKFSPTKCGIGFKGYRVPAFHPTLEVKVFALLPYGNQLFWFRETFLQIKSPAPKFWAPWQPKWSQLGGLSSLPGHS